MPYKQIPSSAGWLSCVHLNDDTGNPCEHRAWWHDTETEQDFYCDHHRDRETRKCRFCKKEELRGQLVQISPYTSFAHALCFVKMKGLYWARQYLGLTPQRMRFEDLLKAEQKKEKRNAKS